MEKISIVVPVYNVAKYLDDCINSIINQTYNDLEIILVDDGSTDNSGKICDRYKEKDSRIKVFHKKNGGLSDARNYGLDHMTGQYVTFVDSDDIILPKYIELLYESIKRNNSQISVCRFKRFKTLNDIVNLPYNYDDIVLQSKEFYLKVLYQYDHTLYSVSSCAKLYKKNIFKKLRFPKGKLNEDFCVIDDVLKKATIISLIDYELYYYRISENSITNSNFNENKLYVLEHCMNLLNNETDYSIRDALFVTMYTRSIDLLTCIRESKHANKKIEKKLWDNIKKYRNIILKNNFVRKSIKLSAMISFLGKRFLISCNILLRNYKRRKNIQ